ncbi:MAG TPA: dockerin type I domain-containing protein, partial [Lacipirellulaceae bacterium]|nr:dockerin type I domain-containing protein [Lacipirellulaceae bacterium]
GTNTVQEAAMDPEITVGTRKLLTSLDAAALADIGWSIVEPPPPAYHPADFNQDGLVNSPDLTIWRNAFLQTSAGDANGDNRTDGHDFLIWQRSLGQTGALTVAAGVPEPTGAAVAGAVAMAGMHIARRRRGKAV